MMWWHGGPGWGGWLVMSLVMVVFWGLVVAGGIALWRSAGRDRGDRAPAQPPTPEQVLDERFARGEIDVEEYTRRRELLRSGH